MKKVYNKKSRSSFNYIREYINERMPPVKCTIIGKELVINDDVDFEKVIMLISELSKQHPIASSGKRDKTSALTPLSFKQSVERAQRMTKEEFQKYKSKYINHLVGLQDDEKKIVPCVENLAHSGSSIYEEAFIFSIKCLSDRMVIVVENVNPDRSTLLFLINSDQYMSILRTIHSFLQSPEINKRSGLRDGSFDFDKKHVLRNESINHDEDYSSWKFNLAYYINYL